LTLERSKVQILERLTTDGSLGHRVASEVGAAASDGRREPAVSPSRRIPTLAARAALVVASFLLIRWSITRFLALDAEGRREFTTAELLFGWPGFWTVLGLVVAGCAFTVAMRMPLRRGFRWSVAAWGVPPLLLALHVIVYWRAAEVRWIIESEFLTKLLFIDRAHFFHDWAARSAFAVLAGVALGAAIGHDLSKDPRQPPDAETPLRAAPPSVTAATRT
jgi:hypothetical protein